MNYINVDAIEENFKKYFNAEWLVNVIENGGYSIFQCSHKVAIDLETNEVWCMQNNEYSQSKNVVYFSLPARIVDYSEALDGEILEGNYSKNKTLKGYIQDSFYHLGHFCIDDYSGYFYLTDDLLSIQNGELL